MFAGRGDTERDQCGGQCGLRHDQPAATPPEQGQGIAVEQRRPEEFERIGQSHQREQPDTREIDTAVADGPYSVILEQVSNGIAVRMAVLYLLSGRDPNHAMEEH